MPINWFLLIPNSDTETFQHCLRTWLCNIFLLFVKPFTLGAVRFFRKVVAMRDDFYNRYIVKGNLFEPLVSLFNVNRSKYNLLNSALIELFEFIRIVSLHL